MSETLLENFTEKAVEPVFLSETLLHFRGYMVVLSQSIVPKLRGFSKVMFSLIAFGWHFVTMSKVGNKCQRL
jgi:hypothetical protein